MRAFLTDLVRWALCGMLVYPVLVAIMGALSPASEHRNLKYTVGTDLALRLGEIEHDASMDILALGSSHAYRGIDPRPFARHGVRLFNLGSSAQTPLHTEILLAKKRVSPPPKLVLIDVFPASFHQINAEATMELIANDRVDRRMAELVLGSPQISHINTLIYALVRQCIGIAPVRNVPRTRPNGDLYVTGGYVQRGDTTWRYRPPAHALVWQPMPAQVQALERIVERAQEQGSTVVLLQTPAMPAFRMTGDAGRAATAYFNSLATYYDMSTLFPPADSVLFYDGHHLKPRGVERFNAALIARLQADGLME